MPKQGHDCTSGCMIIVVGPQEFLGAGIHMVVVTYQSTCAFLYACGCDAYMNSGIVSDMKSGFIPHYSYY